MRNWQYQTGIGDSAPKIPGGQLVMVSLVAHATLGSYMSIGKGRGIYVPPGRSFTIGARELGALFDLDSGVNACDQFPGEQVTTVKFGAPARPADALPDASGAPQTWFVAWMGGTFGSNQGLADRC